jgi:hypothetical protein
MRVYFESDDTYEGIRAHPYEGTSGGPEEAYYDFKEKPELIPQVLEDFKTWEEHEAIQVFYEMLRWLNGEDSALESSDCALARQLGENRSKGPFPRELECSGRLMVFYRNLNLNVSPRHVEWLKGATHFHLNRLDPEFEMGAIGLFLTKASYLHLQGQLGNQLVILFFAFGDNEQEVMENLRRLFVNLYEALKCVSEELKGGGA